MTVKIRNSCQDVGSLVPTHFEFWHRQAETRRARLSMFLVSLQLKPTPSSLFPGSSSSSSSSPSPPSTTVPHTSAVVPKRSYTQCALIPGIVFIALIRQTLFRAMSQPSTPQATPSRRRPPASTPGSARSVASTSANTTLDRSTLNDRIEDLELECHDLRRQVNAERERRKRPASVEDAEEGSGNLVFIDPTGRSKVEIKAVLLERLKGMDDDALTSLLTATTRGLVGLIGGKGLEGGLDPAIVPSKSVGIEGTGSGSDIDRRLSEQKEREEGKGGLKDELVKTRHVASINAFLQDRQKRTTALINSLTAFTHLNIDTLDQVSTSPTSRSISILGSFANLFPLDIRFDVVEQDPILSPRINNLKVLLPSWLSTTLNAHNNLFSKLQKRNDLPSILLMLRTMIPLIALRRNVFTSLMESYTDLVRDHVRSWEDEHGVDFTPYHPSSSSSRKRRGMDEALAKSLITPTAAERLVLRNKTGASLTLHFVIEWNRFGHASPSISAKPNIPRDRINATNTAFLETFADNFQHLLKVAIAQDGIVGLPDHDAEDGELDTQVGRWGVMPAIHATIRAFFGLGGDESASDDSR